MKVQTIATNAIYMSLQDRQHEPNINAGYLDFAVTQINSILNEWRDLIPFSEQVTFTNVDDLQATNFGSIVNVNFVLQQVSAPLQEVNLTRFLEMKSVLNLSGIPEIYYFDQLTQTIEVYPRPSNPSYRFLVNGRILHLNLGQFDDIPANLPGFAVNAITYETAYRLVGQYPTYWDPKKEDTRKYLYNLLQRKNTKDITPARDIVFGGDSGIPPYPWLWAISGGPN